MIHPPDVHPRIGTLYIDHVPQADEGSDFLRFDGESYNTLPLGLLHGWVGGW